MIKDPLEIAENKCHHNLYQCFCHHNLYRCFWHTKESGKEMLQWGHLSAFARSFIQMEYATINDWNILTHMIMQPVKLSPFAAHKGTCFEAILQQGKYVR